MVLIDVKPQYYWDQVIQKFMELAKSHHAFRRRREEMPVEETIPTTKIVQVTRAINVPECCADDIAEDPLGFVRKHAVPWLVVQTGPGRRKGKIVRGLVDLQCPHGYPMRMRVMMHAT
jgi:hypothetical protein